MTEAAVIGLIVQGGFAALFVWLLFDVRKESRERTATSNTREDKLHVLLSKALEQLNPIATSLTRLEQSLNEHDKAERQLWLEVLPVIRDLHERST